MIIWIQKAIGFAALITLAALGELLTEKSGGLNLGTPGTMCVGAATGFPLLPGRTRTERYSYTPVNAAGFVPFRNAHRADLQLLYRHIAYKSKRRRSRAHHFRMRPCGILIHLFRSVFFRQRSLRPREQSIHGAHTVGFGKTRRRFGSAVLIRIHAVCHYRHCSRHASGVQ